MCDTNNHRIIIHSRNNRDNKAISIFTSGHVFLLVGWLRTGGPVSLIMALCRRGITHNNLIRRNQARTKCTRQSQLFYSLIVIYVLKYNEFLSVPKLKKRVEVFKNGCQVEVVNEKMSRLPGKRVELACLLSILPLITEHSVSLPCSYISILIYLLWFS